MNHYIIDYVNYNEFKKKERAIKKYNMLVYKKLVFDYYPKMQCGEFLGTIVSKTANGGIKYELKFPKDSGVINNSFDIIVHYTVYENDKVILLEIISSEDVLLNNDLCEHDSDKDMFKINLLCALADNFGDNNKIITCIKCGSQLEIDHNFCPYCGFKR